ncbi:MAG: polyhydroxyalkanoic acid system family protein [Planctomycetota bacterium]|nr:polyhydroxyalkanoic acid system family protein [Planctomycetota bacterium]
MPALKFSFPNPLNQADATERLKQLFERLKQQHSEKFSDLQENWVDNVLKFAFSTYGFKIQGDLSVTDEEVRLDGTIPFTAMIFKGKIEKELKETLSRILT